MATVSIYIDNRHKSGETIGKHFHSEEFNTIHFQEEEIANISVQFGL